MARKPRPMPTTATSSSRPTITITTTSRATSRSCGRARRARRRSRRRDLISSRPASTTTTWSAPSRALRGKRHGQLRGLELRQDFLLACRLLRTGGLEDRGEDLLDLVDYRDVDIKPLPDECLALHV